MNKSLPQINSLFDIDSFLPLPILESLVTIRVLTGDAYDR